MQVNNIIEFKYFLNGLKLDAGYTKNFLHHSFINKNKDFYILDIEKRKVIQTSQTSSLESEWISHIEEVTIYELYIEYMEQSAVDTIALTFKTLKDLKKAEQFINDNFKFLKK